MKLLVFDTETTGLIPKNTSIYDTEQYPYIVQISWILYDTSLNDKLSVRDFIINVGDVNIPPESSNIHKITNEISKSKGVDINYALDHFEHDLSYADVIVAHNIWFDKRMYLIECIRNRRKYSGFTLNGVKKTEYCTMKKTTKFCNLKRTTKNGKKVIKYPTLSELHYLLFGYNPENTHNSMVDVEICLKCLLKLYCFI